MELNKMLHLFPEELVYGSNHAEDYREEATFVNLANI